jgi:serine/threonine-protein kinase RsbW
MRDTSATRTFAIDAREVARIDDWLEQVGRAWSADARTMLAVRLCVAELAANALEHGVPGRGADEMIVSLRRVPDGIAVEFRDSRAPFDPTVPPRTPRADDIASTEPSGRGLPLLHAYARHLSYLHDGTHNRVTLTVPPA